MSDHGALNLQLTRTMKFNVQRIRLPNMPVEVYASEKLYRFRHSLGSHTLYGNCVCLFFFEVRYA